MSRGSCANLDRSRLPLRAIAALLFAALSASGEPVRCTDHDLTVGVFAAMSDVAYEGDTNPEKPSDAERYRHDIAVLQAAGFGTLSVDALGAVNWTNLMNLRDPSKTPYARIFMKTDESGITFVIAFRGSDPHHIWPDWGTDAIGALGVVPAYYEKADQLVHDFIGWCQGHYPAHNVHLYLTGHSLGGGMAEFAAAHNYLRAVTFNSAHLSQGFYVRLSKHGDFPNEGPTVVASYHATAVNYGPFGYGGDVVNFLRLGGNYEQTRIAHVPCGTYDPITSHFMRTFLSERPEWHVPPFPAALSDIGDDRGRNDEAARSLLESTPTLVADLPVLVRDAMRRHIVDTSPAFSDGDVNVRPAMFDIRARLAWVMDSHPSGGIPVENLRVFDETIGATATVPGQAAHAFAVSGSWTHPVTASLGLEASWSYETLRYPTASVYDFSTQSVTFGPLLTLPNGDTAALAGTWRNFQLDSADIGAAWGAEVAEAHNLSSGNLVVWGTAAVSSIQQTSLRHGNGLLVEETAGLRTRTFRGQLALQPRMFVGVRTARDSTLNNEQWGVACGACINARNYRWRLFLEPGVRWTQHHILNTMPAGLKDEEYLLRVQADYNLSFRLGEYRLVNWTVSGGVQRTRAVSTRAEAQYNREIWTAGLNKRY